MEIFSFPIYKKPKISIFPFAKLDKIQINILQTHMYMWVHTYVNETAAWWNVHIYVLKNVLYQRSMKYLNWIDLYFVTNCYWYGIFVSSWYILVVTETLFICSVLHNEEKTTLITSNLKLKNFHASGAWTNDLSIPCSTPTELSRLQPSARNLTNNP